MTQTNPLSSLAQAAAEVSPLSQVILSLSPNTGQLMQFFYALAHLPPSFTQALVNQLDSQALAKIAVWTEAFVKALNDAGSPERIQSALQPETTADFFAAMANVQFRGQKLTPENIATASRDMTTAIKAQNWSAAIWTGISLGRLMAV